MTSGGGRDSRGEGWSTVFSSGEVHVERSGGVLCVTFLCERVSDHDVDELFIRLEPMLGGAEGLIVDISRVSVLTSAGIGLLVRLHKRLRVGGGRFIVCGLSEELEELFAITCMDRLLRVERDRAAAERGMAG